MILRRNLGPAQVSHSGFHTEWNFRSGTKFHYGYHVNWKRNTSSGIVGSTKYTSAREYYSSRAYARRGEGRGENFLSFLRVLVLFARDNFHASSPISCALLSLGNGGLCTSSLRRVRSGQQNEDLNKCMSTTYFVEFTAFVSVHFGSFKISFLQVISRQEKISRTEFSHGHNLLNKQQHAVIWILSLLISLRRQLQFFWEAANTSRYWGQQIRTNILPQGLQ